MHAVVLILCYNIISSFITGWQCCLWWCLQSWGLQRYAFMSTSSEKLSESLYAVYKFVVWISYQLDSNYLDLIPYSWSIENYLWATMSFFYLLSCGFNAPGYSCAGTCIIWLDRVLFYLYWFKLKLYALCASFIFINFLNGDVYIWFYVFYLSNLFLNFCLNVNKSWCIKCDKLINFVC